MKQFAFQTIVAVAAFLVAMTGSSDRKNGVPHPVLRNAANSRTEEELKALENEAVQAQLNADMAAIDRIFSDDFILVDDEAEVRDKKAEFAPYKTDEERMTAGQLDEMTVRVYGEAAVVTGRYVFKGSFQGKPFDLKGRFTDVFVKQKGHWRIVSLHNSSFPKEQKS